MWLNVELQIICEVDSFGVVLALFFFFFVRLTPTVKSSLGFCFIMVTLDDIRKDG